jgi:hypothetical protein
LPDHSHYHFSHNRISPVTAQAALRQQDDGRNTFQKMTRDCARSASCGNDPARPSLAYAVKENYHGRGCLIPNFSRNIDLIVVVVCADPRDSCFYARLAPAAL